MVQSLRFRAAGVLVLALLAPAAIAQSTFVQTVKQNFNSWDANNDGVLSPDEVDRLTVDPTVRGDAAAAVAVMKLAMRSKKDPVAQFTLAEVEHAADAPLVVEGDAPLPAAAKNRDTYQTRYARAARVIRTVKRDLFRDPTPDLDGFHQGRIGDCFFVSMVGEMVEHDSQSVKRMIRPEAGGYDVTFGNGQTVGVPALTDAEFALASTTGGEGIWLPVLEKAFGSVRMRSRAEDKQAQSMTDAIAGGGSIAMSIQYLSGHKAETLRLRGKAAPTPGEREELAARVKAKVIEAIKARRLIGAGTDASPGVPGITPNHAFAIFGIDAQAGVLHLWNPHGNTFKPKGPAGLEHGYPTKGGRFDMPLGDFVATFRGVTFETGEALANPEEAAHLPGRKPRTPTAKADAPKSPEQTTHK